MSQKAEFIAVNANIVKIAPHSSTRLSRSLGTAMGKKNIEILVAKTLFATDLTTSGAELSTDNKKAKWSENKSEYLQSARKFIRVLERNGVSLTQTVQSTES